MKKDKYYTEGFETGYDIATCNILELDTDNPDKFVSDMLETESEHYRQFSPFEFLAQEINDYESRWNCEGRLWDCYDAGVYDGIMQAVKEKEQAQDE